LYMDVLMSLRTWMCGQRRAANQAQAIRESVLVPVFTYSNYGRVPVASDGGE